MHVINIHFLVIMIVSFKYDPVADVHLFYVHVHVHAAHNGKLLSVDRVIGL